MVYDVNGGVTIVAGGGRESGSSFINLTDLWEWDGETWIRREEECPARWQTASAFDSVRGVIVLNGGLYVERQTWEGTRQLFGDIDGDHVVTLTDLSELLARFGLQGQPLRGDLNGDWAVDLSDLSILLSTFGESCN